MRAHHSSVPCLLPPPPSPPNRHLMPLWMIPHRHTLFENNSFPFWPTAVSHLHLQCRRAHAHVGAWAWARACALCRAGAWANPQGLQEGPAPGTPLVAVRPPLLSLQPSSCVWVPAVCLRFLRPGTAMSWARAFTRACGLHLRVHMHGPGHVHVQVHGHVHAQAPQATHRHGPAYCAPQAPLVQLHKCSRARAGEDARPGPSN